MCTPARLLHEIARVKRAAFRDDTYWGRPVPGFGDPHARVLVLGLAPAAHGANRTGRVFTGDGGGGSGDFLMTAMHRNGFASIPTSRSIDDGLQLHDAFIAAAVRCAPPDNKPEPDEIAACLPHLEAELALLANIRVVVALGKDCVRRVVESDVRTRVGCETAAAIHSWRCLQTRGRPNRDRVVSPEPSEHPHGQTNASDALVDFQEGGEAGQYVVPSFSSAPAPARLKPSTTTTHHNHQPTAFLGL